jgi:ABC-type glycerol-3-phosphate transport system permease component
MPKRLIFGFPRQVILWLMTLLALFPIYFMVVTSLKTEDSYMHNHFGIPSHPSLTNFISVLGNNQFFTWFGNSILLTLTSVVASCLLACMGAFAIAKLELPGRGFWFNLMSVLMVIPPVVMVIPLFQMIVNMGLINTYQSVILIYTGLLLPFSIYLLTNFFREVPDSLIEAARIDGASSFSILWRIILPMAVPAFVTLVIINALWVWNELLISVIFLQDDSMKTLMAGLTVFQSRYTLNVPATMAGLMIATIPIVLLYLGGQKYFIKGLTAGANKGE